MSLLYTTRLYNQESKDQAVKDLLENSLPDRDFYLLVIGAIILATCGILTDSLPVLIASMIVAPLAYPILALSLGLVSRNGKLILRSAGTLAIAIILTVIIGGCFSVLLKNHFVFAERTLISFFPNIFFDLLIAIVSGGIAVYGLIRLKVGGAMTGIGIAVSLMPPLVATGIGVFDSVSDLAFRGCTIFLLNVGGILVGSCIAFLFFGMHKQGVVIKNNI